MEIILAVYVTVFTLTGISLLFYFKRINKIYSENKKSEKFLEDIIFSFKKDLEKERERIDLLETKEETREKEKSDLFSNLFRHIESVKARTNNLEETSEKLIVGQSELRNKIESIILLGRTNQKNRLNDYKRQVENPEINIRTPMPIKEEKILAPLTDTELVILDAIQLNKEMTSRQIREHIRLTREHTARLLKKLYAAGYLERRTNKIPYTYVLNKEMADFLRTKTTH